METLLANQRRTAGTRTVREGGLEYLVAPVRMIVPGVLAGSKGPLFYPPEEINRNVADWEGIPLTLGHPYSPASGPLSAASPGVREKFGLGWVRNPRGGKSLDAEAWFDVAAVRRLAPEILDRLGRGEKIELSTGLFTNNVPAPPGSNFNGRPYSAVATDYKPDHLAVLLGERGACSLADGCGVLVNAGGADLKAVLAKLLQRLAG